MLTYEQSKAIENALGADKAAPILEALQASDQRVMSALLAEVATKEDLAIMKADIVGIKASMATKEDVSALDARMVKMDILLKVLIGLVSLAVAFFSPVADKILAVLLK